MKKFLAGFLTGNCAPLDLALKPLLLFYFRFYVAFIFFMSGLTKVVNPWRTKEPLSEILNSNYQVSSTTIDLFSYEYNVPVLSPELAAYLATYAELFLPILLVIGLVTRPVALGLFVLNAVAAISLAQTDFSSAAGHWQHILWGAMLMVVFVFGPGKVSIDQWISDNILEKNTSLLIKLLSITLLFVAGYFIATKYLGM